MAPPPVHQHAYTGGTGKHRTKGAMGTRLGLLDRQLRIGCQNLVAKNSPSIQLGVRLPGEVRFGQPFLRAFQMLRLRHRPIKIPFGRHACPTTFPFTRHVSPNAPHRLAITTRARRPETPLASSILPAPLPVTCFTVDTYRARERVRCSSLGRS